MGGPWLKIKMGKLLKLLGANFIVCVNCVGDLDRGGESPSTVAWNASGRALGRWIGFYNRDENPGHLRDYNYDAVSTPITFLEARKVVREINEIEGYAAIKVLMVKKA